MNFDVVERLLDVPAPWIVHDVSLDSSRRRVEVSIGRARTGWFGARRTVERHEGHHKIWQHLNIGNLACYVRVDYARGSALPDVPWCGDTKSPFSRSLSHKVVSLMGEGVSLGTIAKLLQVDPELLWQFQHSLEKGVLSNIESDDPGVVEQPDQAEADGIPGPANPIWDLLLTGKHSIDTRNLGFQLLLSRLRRQYVKTRDAEIRRLKIQELRRYCERNQTSAQHEIGQIQEAAQ